MNVRGLLEERTSKREVHQSLNLDSPHASHESQRPREIYLCVLCGCAVHKISDINKKCPNKYCRISKCLSKRFINQTVAWSSLLFYPVSDDQLIRFNIFLDVYSPTSASPSIGIKYNSSNYRESLANSWANHLLSPSTTEVSTCRLGIDQYSLSKVGISLAGTNLKPCF